MNSFEDARLPGHTFGDSSATPGLCCLCGGREVDHDRINNAVRRGEIDKAKAVATEAGWSADDLESVLTSWHWWNQDNSAETEPEATTELADDRREIVIWESLRVRVACVTDDLGVKTYDVEVRPVFGNNSDEWVSFIGDVSEQAARQAYALIKDTLLRTKAAKPKPFTPRQVDDLSDSLVRLVKAGRIGEAREKARANGWPEDTVDEVMAFHDVKCAPEDHAQTQDRVNRLPDDRINDLVPIADYFAVAANLARNAAPSPAGSTNSGPVASFYPGGWPACPACGEPAMDGHITCGRMQCDEGGHRNDPGSPEAAGGVN
jgi:hypothetical protein